MKHHCLIAALIVAAAPAAIAQLQTPALIPYQGRVQTGNPAADFTGTGQFKFALVAGTANASQQAFATAVRTGNVISTINVIEQGFGYTTPPAVTITGGGGSGATATSVVSNGRVTAINVNQGGGNYTSTPTVTIAAPPARQAFVWVNHGNIVGDPVNAVPVPVTNGLYSVLLGDDTLNNMALIPPSAFLERDLRLRVWFNGTQLIPDQRLAPNGYLASGTQVRASSGNGSPVDKGFTVFNPSNLAFQDASLGVRVAGSGAGNPFLSFDIANEAGWAIGIDNQDGNKLKFSNAWDSLAAAKMTITPAGLVGIGTTTPKGNLHVNGDYYGRGHMFLHAFEGDGASGTAYVQARDDSGTSSIGMTFRTQSAGSHRATMVLQPGGDVGIGNLSLLPGRRLGTAVADSATLDIPGTNGFIGIWDNMEVSSSVYVHGEIHREFNNAWYKLGNLGGNGYGTYWESSDQRLKKEIAPLTGALDTLGQIRGVSYLWNEAGLQHLTRSIEETWASKSGTEADNKKLWAEKRAEAAKELSRRQTGFIAQELEKVFPSWVRTDEKGFKQIDVHSMAAVLVQGVNELSAQNREQAAALTELEKANTALKARIAELEATAKAGDARLAKLETTTTNLAALLEKHSAATTTAGVSTVPAKP